MIIWSEHPSAVARMRELWNEGLSASRIARILAAEFRHDLAAITKNAVIGASHRLGFPSRQSPIRYTSMIGPPTFSYWLCRNRPKIYGPPTFEDWYRRQRNQNRIPAPKATLPPLRSSEIKAPAIVTAAPRVSESSPCCWPIGEPRTPGFRMCDAPSLVGRSYCPTHHAKAYKSTAPVTSMKDIGGHWSMRAGLGFGR